MKRRCGCGKKCDSKAQMTFAPLSNQIVRRSCGTLFVAELPALLCVPPHDAEEAGGSGTDATLAFVADLTGDGTREL